MLLENSLLLRNNFPPKIFLRALVEPNLFRNRNKSKISFRNEICSKKNYVLTFIFLKIFLPIDSFHPDLIFHNYSIPGMLSI